MSRYIDGYRDRFGVEPICRVLGVSVSAYYQRAKGNRSKRSIEDEFYLELVKTEHRENYEAYGYRRMWKHLQRIGVRIGRDRVRRLMRENGIVGAKNRGKRCRTTLPGDSSVSLVDLLNRDFTSESPNCKWVADFTYLRCWEGVCYFSFVIDTYSRRVVGWQFAKHMRTSLVLDALEMALYHRDRYPTDVGVIHHSDRGSQYLSSEFIQTLDDHNVLGSVGSTGDAYDNAMAESFVDSFKTELIKDRAWKTIKQLEQEIVKYVSWFNTNRLHESLGDIPPAELETNHQKRYSPQLALTS